MNEFMKILLSLSVSGTLLLLLILGLKPLYRNKFSRCWQYYIWIIVALRFLLPFTPDPDTTIVGSLFEKADTEVRANEIPAGSDAPAFVDADDSKAEQKPTDKNILADAAMRKPLDVSACLFLIWMSMALVQFARKITRYQGFIQYIKAGNREVSDIRLLNLLSDCKEKWNVKIRAELYQNPSIASPMLTGFFRPGIILPARELEDRELSHIFAHELIHCRQKDLFYKWLIQIVVCVHWFNPFVYLLEKEVNQSCELSCDEKVISALDHKARREYGDTLISFLKPDNLRKNSFASVTLTEGAEQIKERLGAIMKFRKKSKSVIVVTALFSAAVCACFFVTGAYAAHTTANDDTKWKDSEILNDVLTEDGVYYIFSDGAGEKDKPRSSVSVGSIQFVVVRKDGYTSIGPFDKKETLVEDVAKQCEYMKNLTEEEKKSVIETAMGILENAGEEAMSIVYESAGILRYEDGSPYIHAILTNHTEKRIIETEYCMLAYDEKGSALKLHWNFLDSGAESSYEKLVRTRTSILPDQTADYPGGWSLHDDRAAYSLFCLKQVVFEDGTVWDNPDYEDWFQAYAGKEMEIDELQNYYPYKSAIY